MKRGYDFEELRRELGFDPRQLEKACRISDLIEEVSNVVFLRDRLSLYGGTALALIHLDEVLRLSIDLDFNNRHLDEGDWGAVRDLIDDRIKRLLYVQEYRQEDLAVQATYPLEKITVQYENHLGQNDSFKIEIGYMRRIPILPRDFLAMLRHIATGEEFPVKTPQPEELYANKWCTLLYRGSSWDLFARMDVAKFLGLIYPCNLSLISHPHLSGGGEAWGCSPQPIRTGPTRHREDSPGAIPRRGTGEAAQEPHGHLQGPRGQEAEADTQ